MRRVVLVFLLLLLTATTSLCIELLVSKTNDYTVTYESNGGSVLDEFTGKIIEEQPVVYKEGYTFAGWYKNYDFSDDEIIFPYRLKANTTFYAKWIINDYKITFKDYDGAVLKEETVEYGSSATAPIAPDNKEGHTFLSWDIEYNYITENLVVTAIYTINRYNVVFKDYDGTVLKEETVEYGSSATAPIAPDNKEGHTFLSWDIEYNYITENLVVTALYEINKYTVTWKNYDDTILEIDLNVNWNTLPVYDGKTPVKEGNEQFYYEFSGWTPELERTTGDITYVALYVRYIRQYNVTFKDYDGAVLKEETVEYGSSATAPIAPDNKEGHTFLSWNIEYNYITENLVVTAIYTINRYNVVFKDYDGTVLKVETVEYGSSATAPIAPDNKEGHTFLSWDIEYNYITENLVVTALYEINKYTVTWKNYDDTILEIDLNVNWNTLPVYDGETPVRLKNQEFTYIFSGWDKEIVLATEDVVYVAQYSFSINQYKVVFKDFDGTILNEEMVSYGGAATTLEEPNNKIGYSFDKWNVSFDFIVDDLEVTAIYKIIYYSIEFVLDGVIWDNNPNPQYYTIIDDDIILSTDELLKTGYHSPVLSTNLIPKGSIGDFKIFIEWRKKAYNITFDSNAGDTVEPNYFEFEEILPLSTKTGYEFLGWCLSEEYDNGKGIVYNDVIDFGEHEENLILYAKWEIEQYTIVFSSNGADNVFAREITTHYKTNIIIPEPNKKGFVFAGWYLDSEFTVFLADAGDYKVIDLGDNGDTVDVFAKWTRESYSLNFNVNGGSSVDNKNYLYGENLPKPIREGYTFLGWQTAEKNTISTTPDFGDDGTQVNLLASWEIESYRLVLVYNDGITANTESEIVFNSVFGDLPIPTMPNYYFLGWYLDSHLTIGINAQTIVEDYGEAQKVVRLYAAWQVNELVEEILVDIYYYEGTDLLLTSSVTYGNKYGTLYDLELRGYASKWYYESEFITEVTQNTIVNKLDSHVLHLKRELITYTITYVIEGDAFNDFNPYYYTIESPLIYLADIEKPGFNFYGWYLDKQYTQLIEYLPTDVIGDLVLYACFGDYGSFGIEYTFQSSSNSYIVTGYNKTSSELVVPMYFHDRINGFLMVTDILANVFSGCTNLKNVIISSSIKNIGFGAFAGCSQLESITIPFIGSGVSSTSNLHFGYIFGADSYSKHTSLLPHSLNKVIITGGSIIAESAFRNCSYIEYILLPRSMNSLASNAFYGCSSLKNIVIPEGVISIGTSAFRDCINLESIDISSTVKTINSTAFYGCSSLKEITIPAGVTTIGNFVFNKCSSLSKVVLLGEIVSIAQYAFADCSSLESINIPGSLTSIGNYAFYNCSNLKSIIIPGGVKSIGTSVFQNCISLESITFFSGLETIGKDTFNNCQNLKNISLPSSLRSIGDNAFYGCQNLKSIIIPNNVEGIGSGAFRGCLSLESITIPFVGNTINDETNTHFGYIFGASTYSTNATFVPASLKTVIVSGGTSITKSAFEGCNYIQNLTLPFVGNRLNGTTNTHFGYIFGATSYTNNAGHVPSSLKSITITQGNIIDANTFRGCSNLETIIIPDSVTSIGANAFYSCNSLKDFIFPSNIQTIENSAFYDCKSLMNLQMPIGLISIGQLAFYNCINLKNIIVPASVTMIGSAAFEGTLGLESITVPFVGDALNNPLNTHFGYIFGANQASENNTYLPNSLKTVIITGGKSIESMAFYDCINISSIILSNNLTRIESFAFYGCENLTEINISKCVIYIGNSAFANCTNIIIYIDFITIPEQWDENFNPDNRPIIVN